MEGSSGLGSLFYITETSSNPDHPPFLWPSVKKETPLNETPFVWLVMCFFVNVPVQILGSAKSEKSETIYMDSGCCQHSLTLYLKSNSYHRHCTCVLSWKIYLKKRTLVLQLGNAHPCKIFRSEIKRFQERQVKCFWCGNTYFMAESHYCMPAQIKGF